MKPTQSVFLAVAFLGFSTAASHAQGMELDFANLSSTAIQFNGSSDSFNLTTAGGFQWSIVADTGGNNTANGLSGSITGGPFSYGPITAQSAPVSTLGELVISDGSHNLTGTVNWVNVATLGVAVGVFNQNLAINVTDLAYTGSNPDLQALVYNQDAILDLSFSFLPGKNLTQLSTGTGPYDTGFSGSIYSVPEPAPLALTAVGGLALLFYRRCK